MAFNQEMALPSFLKDEINEQKRGRSMIALSELDVTRDIMDFQFVRNSKAEDPIEFFISLTNWTEHKLEVLVNFTKPILISNGAQLDQVLIKIKNRDYFISKGGKMLREDQVNLG